MDNSIPWNTFNYLSRLGLEVIHVSLKTLVTTSFPMQYEMLKSVEFLWWWKENPQILIEGKSWAKHMMHDDVIKWKHFPRYWPFVRGFHRSPVNYPHKGQWRGALMFALICAWINGWVNNGEAGDLRRHRTNYDVNVMCCTPPPPYSRYYHMDIT